MAEVHRIDEPTEFWPIKGNYALIRVPDDPERSYNAPDLCNSVRALGKVIADNYNDADMVAGLGSAVKIVGR